jgi:endonuclease G, mitochondrial
MKPPARIETAARRRVARAESQINRSVAAIARGNPLAAERDLDRLLVRLQTKAQLSREEAEAVVAGIQSMDEPPQRAKGGPEAVWGSTIDFVGVAFLERGYRSARAVARIAFRDGRAQGTGFLISDQLLVTNNHVISSPEEAASLVAEFEYELDPSDQVRTATRFALDPNTFFLTDDVDDLDYTIVAVGKRLSGPRELKDFGWCFISDAEDKHALGEVANIVQHPDGRHKEVVLRENRLVARLESVIHYVADTEPGASGSPVFNNEWKVIGLHHWGGPWRQKVDPRGRPLAREVNEAIRVSAIVKEVRQKATALSQRQRQMLLRVLQIGERQEAPPVESSAGNGLGAGLRSGARIEPDGRVVWSLPLELSMRFPMGDGDDAAQKAAAPVTPDVEVAMLEAADRKVKVDPNYDNRSGYKPTFIAGFRIDPPQLSAAQKKIAAKKTDVEAGDDPHVLDYEHFSVVINKQRKLAFWTACNIDGTTAKSISRKTGKVTPRKPGDGESAEDAEAREEWFADPRLDPDDYTHDGLYTSQKVGTAKPGTKAFTDGMFQRGHLVRRADPAWGADTKAVKADADTFHFTNAAPQVGFFNQGTAAKTLKKSGGGRLWRALEDYVLDNAVDEQKRVTVLTGPVFSAKDPEYRTHVIPGFRVPLKFWKIVLWAEKGKLRATAMVADQAPVLKKMPEALPGGEAFADTAAVKDFLTTIAAIEKLTGLKFGPVVKGAELTVRERERLEKAVTT